MRRQRNGPPNYVPNIEDFILTERQRNFHDAYINGSTRGNAHASALVAGYNESVAKSDSSKWIPGTGHTPESIRKAKPIAQAIFWTQFREQTIREAVTERSTEAQIKRQVISKEYVENGLLEIVERCLGHEVKDARGRDLAMLLTENLVAAKLIEPKNTGAIADAFRDYCRRHGSFRPTQAKEALKLLGLEVGMFMKRVVPPKDTPIDNMTPDELIAEKERLEAQFRALTKQTKKEPIAGRKIH